MVIRQWSGDPVSFHKKKRDATEKVCDKSADSKSELSKKVTSVSSLLCDSLLVNAFLFFFVPPAQLSQSHDHSSNS